MAPRLPPAQVSLEGRRASWSRGRGWGITVPCSCVLSGSSSVCSARFSCGLAQKTHFSFLSWDTFGKTKILNNTGEKWTTKRKKHHGGKTEGKYKIKVNTCFFSCLLLQHKSNTIQFVPFLEEVTVGYRHKGARYTRTSLQDGLEKKIYNLRGKERELWLRN